MTEEVEQKITRPKPEVARGEVERGETEQLESYRKRSGRSDNAVGVAFAERGNMEMAADFFRRAHRSDPENFRYWANLAVAYYMLGRYDRALREYEEIVMQNPELTPQLDFIESEGEEPAPDGFFQ